MPDESFIDRRSSVERDSELRKIAAIVAADLASSTAAAASSLAASTAVAAQSLADATRVDLDYIKRDLQDIKDRLDSKFVSLDVFDPIRRLVYGLVALVMMSVVGALLTLVLRKG